MVSQSLQDWFHATLCVNDGAWNSYSIFRRRSTITTRYQNNQCCEHIFQKQEHLWSPKAVGILGVRDCTFYLWPDSRVCSCEQSLTDHADFLHSSWGQYFSLVELHIVVSSKSSRKRIKRWSEPLQRSERRWDYKITGENIQKRSHGGLLAKCMLGWNW